MPKSLPLPPIEELRERINYNPETGEFTDRKGNELGSKSGTYLRLSWGRGRQLKGHRVAWYLHHGHDPGELQVDHINRDPFDNRISNLRLATHQENCWNSKVNSKGWQKRKGRYHVYARTGGKASTYFGTYDTQEEAEQVYRDVRLMLAGKYAPNEFRKQST